jgi:hypothetical protein
VFDGRGDEELIDRPASGVDGEGLHPDCRLKRPGRSKYGVMMSRVGSPAPEEGR